MKNNNPLYQYGNPVRETGKNSGELPIQGILTRILGYPYPREGEIRFMPHIPPGGFYYLSRTDYYNKGESLTNKHQGYEDETALKKHNTTLPAITTGDSPAPVISGVSIKNKTSVNMYLSGSADKTAPDPENHSRFAGNISGSSSPGEEEGMKIHPVPGQTGKVKVFDLPGKSEERKKFPLLENKLLPEEEEPPAPGYDPGNTENHTSSGPAEKKASPVYAVPRKKTGKPDPLFRSSRDNPSRGRQPVKEENKQTYIERGVQPDPSALPGKTGTGKILFNPDKTDPYFQCNKTGSISTPGKEPGDLKQKEPSLPGAPFPGTDKSGAPLSFLQENTSGLDQPFPDKQNGDEPNNRAGEPFKEKKGPGNAPGNTETGETVKKIPGAVSDDKQTKTNIQADYNKFTSHQVIEKTISTFKQAKSSGSGFSPYPRPVCHDAELNKYFSNLEKKRIPVHKPPGKMKVENKKSKTTSSGYTQDSMFINTGERRGNPVNRKQIIVKRIFTEKRSVHAYWSRKYQGRFLIQPVR